MIHKKYILFILAFCSSIAAYSQSFVSGIVTDPNGKPVFAANIYLKHNPTKGVISDFDGKFKLPFSGNNDTLLVSFIGYKNKQIALKNSSKTTELKITLEPNNQVLQEIVIKGQNPISEKFSVVMLKKMDIYLNPVSQGDALKAITLLPASTTTDESANPSLRGSSADRSRVMLNGVPIYNPVRNSQINGIGNFSLFNTEIIGKQFVYASNPPLTYGNTSAGLVEIATINKLDNSQLQLSSSLANQGIFLSQKINKSNFFQLYGNYQSSDGYIALNKKNLPNLKKFGSTDLGFNFHSNLGKNWNFNSFTYGIKEEFSTKHTFFTYTDDLNSSDRRVFTVNNLSYHMRKAVLSLNSGINYSDGNFSFGSIHSKISSKQVYSSLNYKWHVLETTDLQLGISDDYQENIFDDTIPMFYYADSPESPKVYSKKSLSNNNLELYYYTNWDKNKHISFSSGMRGNIPLNGQQAYLSSQMGLKLKLNDKHSLLLNGGDYHNYSSPNYEYQKFVLLESSQLALDYSYRGNNTIITAASYYKIETGEQPISNYLLADSVKTFGLEFYFEQIIAKHFKFTFSDTYLKQKQKVKNKEYNMQPDFNYLLKTTFNYSNSKIINATLSFIAITGQYYNPVVNARYDNQTNFYQPFYGEKLYGGQYNDYTRIDLNISKYIPLKKNALIIFLTAANLLNKKNQRDVLYNNDYTNIRFDYYDQRSLYFGAILHLNY